MDHAVSRRRLNLDTCVCGGLMAPRKGFFFFFSIRRFSPGSIILLMLRIYSLNYQLCYKVSEIYSVFKYHS